MPINHIAKFARGVVRASISGGNRIRKWSMEHDAPVGGRRGGSRACKQRRSSDSSAIHAVRHRPAGGVPAARRPRAQAPGCASSCATNEQQADFRAVRLFDHRQARFGARKRRPTSRRRMRRNRQALKSFHRSRRKNAPSTLASITLLAVPRATKSLLQNPTVRKWPVPIRSRKRRPTSSASIRPNRPPRRILHPVTRSGKQLEERKHKGKHHLRRLASSGKGAVKTTSCPGLARFLSEMPKDGERPADRSG